MRAYVRSDIDPGHAKRLELFLESQFAILEPHMTAVFEEHARNHLIYGFPMPTASAMADQVLARARLAGDWPQGDA